MKKKLSLLLIFVLAIGTLAACGQKQQASKHLKIAVDVDLPSMDQQIATDGLSFEVIAATIEGLYTLDKDGNLIPAIATKHEVSNDGLIYTFTLRDDAKWSNGDKVTAGDFVYSWGRLLDPATASEYAFIGEVAGIKNAAAVMAGDAGVETLGVSAPDDTTFVVELERPVPYFLSLTSFPSFYPLNEAFVTSKGSDFALSPDALLANGPFKMVSWNQGYGFVLDKNPDYYDAAKVSLEGLDYRIIKDNQTAALNYENGDLDMVKLTAELVDKYSSNEAYTQIEAGYVWFASPNHQTEVFSNLNARKALQHAINKDYIVDSILNDGSLAANFIIPVKLATGPDGKDFRETAPNNYGLYDVATAQQYWEQAKKELGKDAITIELLFEDAETIKKTAEFIQAELETNLPGLTVNLKSQPKKNRLDLMRAGDYELGLTRWGPDYADPLTYLDLFLTESSNNYPNYTSAQYDAIVNSTAKGDLASKPAERWAAMVDVEKILLEDDAAIAPLFQSGSAYLINPKVSGLEYHTVGINFVYKNVKFE